ncbi:MAG: hypothetical protein COV34_01810 [Candidatus Zambryskibacteria bacterium CG10_big_fil_rev_8_21_14_0_10_42_12]|uniref:Glycerol-3-phosphate dehydrogenase (NAD(P)(+)) n=1 Tax=Candidatus Zambryskibacteria bacterium CG10_big_fil_rev_8_21_14_0_10_42_12 TaxID=1975115 RepID=A0A2H0QVL8_9BACT|nr:MAG: hypothetical protein COV34_01810 [Candidatus Zambryskibacteria bacterium CG10_big_fil_rev_8_21_14_0_10_42_12]
MAVITIIGSGRIGDALYKTLTVREDHDVRMWDVDPTKLEIPMTLEESLRDSAYVLMCVSSWALKAACDEIASYIDDDTKVIALTKGIEPTTHLFVNEYLETRFPGRYALLIGPMIAEEMDGEKPSVALCATEHVWDENIFEGTALTALFTTDITGTALSGILKNVYALGLGITDALNLGQNFKASFAVRAIHEMEQIIVSLGGKKETVYSFAGLGDLIVTGWSPTSRNRTLGEKIAKEGVEVLKGGEGSEGMQSIVHLARRIKGGIPPLYSVVLDIIEGQEKQPRERFMKVVQEG